MRYPAGWGGLTGECGECATLEVGRSLAGECGECATLEVGRSLSGEVLGMRHPRGRAELEQFKKRREIRNGVKSITVFIDSL